MHPEVKSDGLLVEVKLDTTAIQRQSTSRICLG
jgi:hypothetical protein